MANKTLNTKIALLYKSYSDWDAVKATYVPLRGEVCFCEVPASSGAVVNEPCVLFKVGDGEKTFEQLPWASALAADVYAWAKKENLEFSDLSTEFKSKLEEFVEQHSTSVDTQYRIVANGVDKWKLQKSTDGQTWADAEGAIDVSGKVDKELVGTLGTSLIFNEKDGGGSKFVANDGAASYVGTHDNIGGVAGVQIYADKDSAGSESTIIDVTKNGAFYTKGAILPGAQRDVESNEIATKGDISEYSLTKEAGSGEFAAIYHLTKDGVNVGQAINIPKDQLLKSVEVKTCTVKDQPVSGLNVGDKYLDFEFELTTGTVHTYIAIKDMVKPYTAGNGIIITSENAIEVDTEVIATVEYVDASISDTMTYVMQEDAAERAARIAGDNLKVDKEVVGANGTATIFNEADGGGAKFVHEDGTESFVGVNDGGENGLAAQIYADKLVDGKWQGAKLDVTNGGIYYTVGNKSFSERAVEANEVATKGNVDAAVSELDSGLAAIAKTGNVNDLIQDQGDILVLNCNF